MSLSRREIIRSAAAVAATGFAGALAAAPAPRPATKATAAASTRANDRPRFALIGTGGRGRGVAKETKPWGDIIAACDVDRTRLETFNKDFCQGKGFITNDYRKILERKDIDCVAIATTDHWHAQQAAEAMWAGKDVYCEKPLTLTIEEGRILCRVARETGRVLQVGTQQRSEMVFQRAVALVQSGRLGKIKRITCIIKPNFQGGPFPVSDPPAELDWDKWLGPAKYVPYIKQRAHYDFRWWYEYSGGRMTDWGAHFVDIAQWAAAPDLPGPVYVEPLEVEHPVPMKNGMPQKDNYFNTASRFKVKAVFANGLEIIMTDVIPGAPQIDNGIHIVGEKQTMFVNRNEFRGEAAEAYKADPLPDSAFTGVRGGRPLTKHMQNFVECCRDRAVPISDVWSHHRNLTTCHLGNIALRLNRKIQWNASNEQVIGDDEANALVAQPRRQGYELA